MGMTAIGYENLLSLMESRSITFEEMGERLKCSPCRLRARMVCGRDMTVMEAVLLQEHFFPDCTLNYLFYKEEDLHHEHNMRHLR